MTPKTEKRYGIKTVRKKEGEVPILRLSLKEPVHLMIYDTDGKTVATYYNAEHWKNLVVYHANKYDRLRVVRKKVVDIDESDN